MTGESPEMTVTQERLVAEFRAVCRAYGDAQTRCTRLMAAQQHRIEQLEAELVRSRAAAIVRETALAWLRADLARAAVVPEADVLADLEASLYAADLVICKTGCIGHGSYWRVEDHCRRTGKTCVLVEEPDALRIVSIRSEATS